MRLYSYVVAYDIGFAPNPFYGFCTLATCKQDIRARAVVGDWIVGTGSKTFDLQDRLVFGMRVDEILTFNEYWTDGRFERKKPKLHGSLKQQYGDNIYHKLSNNRWIQEDSRHSLEDGTPNEGHLHRDTKADAVMISEHFVYYGGSGPIIPADLRGKMGADLVHGRPSYRVNFPEAMRDAAIQWLESQMDGYVQADPRDWDRVQLKNS